MSFRCCRRCSLPLHAKVTTTGGRSSSAWMQVVSEDLESSSSSEHLLAACTPQRLSLAMAAPSDPTRPQDLFCVGFPCPCRSAEPQASTSRMHQVTVGVCSPRSQELLFRMRRQRSRIRDLATPAKWVPDYHDCHSDACISMARVTGSAIGSTPTIRLHCDLPK